MPRPPHICAYCSRAVAYGARCACRRQHDAERERARPNFRERGYSSAWDKRRKAFLLVHPTCRCGQPATLVDHIKAHQGDRLLFWDTANWQPMCRRCHGMKSVREDGGFWNKRKDIK